MCELKIESVRRQPVVLDQVRPPSAHDKVGLPVLTQLCALLDAQQRCGQPVEAAADEPGRGQPSRDAERIRQRAGDAGRAVRTEEPPRPRPNVPFGEKACGYVWLLV